MGVENRAVDPYDVPQEPSSSDLLLAWSRAIKLEVRTHVPATVVSFDAARNKVGVAVGHKTIVKVTDPTRLPAGMESLKGVPPNAEATLAPIVLSEIPVSWPRTLAGKLTIPIVPGDTGELHVHDRSLDAWLRLGVPCDPVLAITHWLKDSTFHPGLHPAANPCSVDLTATVLDGAALVKIGALAVSAIAKAPELATALASAAAAAGVAAFPGDGGKAAFGAFATTLAGLVGNFTATKGLVQ